ncbi:NAD(P)/FAD-dependent oxidoreductase [Faecalimonas umbilicata]|uniref:NAD(P)/FAD-dependent oxidoreductase n=1 Tax=Faecalimonas umbilicata TaxID=1912855 RepID=UPI002A7F35A8|nr:FAD-dependent oxidoreductase [Faecalimonas umbilicata]MDY4595959.1 FAD-dependent oxidoreductase [Faecalimonas umbilicata]
MTQYVVIGNGVAAVGCIEGIRKEDAAGKIIVISKEPHPVYCRPLISYYLEGKTNLERMAYRDKNFYERMECEVLYGKKAVQIDPSTKQIALNDDTVIPYDKLCIATGSSPFVPPFTGLESVEQKHSFMTIDDMLELEASINENSDVLIVGAGLIGLKCAEGLKDRVSSITICDLADRVLSSILDADCAAIMQKHLEQNGINFMLNDSAISFDKNTAFMKSGKTVRFDVLVLAVGVRAKTSLIKGIGGEVNRGILISNKMETSIPDIYAAGDCTEGEDISFHDKRVLAILPNAYMQGNCAGINMAGGSSVFDKGIPMNSIGFFGLHAMTAGSYYTAEQGCELYEEKSEGTLKRLFTSGDYLTGFILIGATERAGIYTSLIRERIPLSSIDFEMLKKTATSTAFSVEKRKQFFGGVV